MIVIHLWGIADVQLFIVFFLAWQLHGMFCKLALSSLAHRATSENMPGMIQPDRGPMCSAGTIGVFWVS